MTSQLYDEKVWMPLSRITLGVSVLFSKWVRLVPNGTNSGIFFPGFGPIWPTLGSNTTPLPCTCDTPVGPPVRQHLFRFQISGSKSVWYDTHQVPDIFLVVVNSISVSRHGARLNDCQDLFTILQFLTILQQL